MTIRDGDVERFRAALAELVELADDPESFAAACGLLADLEAALARQVGQLRESYTWDALAAASGLTRQGFTRRWKVRLHRQLWELDDPRTTGDSSTG